MDGLTSRDRKPFNVVINLKNGMLEEIASAAIGLGISGAGLATDDNKLISVASILGAVFSALSLTNTILRDYHYDAISEDAFMRAVNNLCNCRYISIVEEILSSEETIKS